jgi:hypothetical protein
MKHPITLRIDTVLLEAARHQAQVENRTLTNFVETILKIHVAGMEAFPDKPSNSLGALATASRPKYKQMLIKKASHG